VTESLSLDEFTACGSHQQGHFLLSSGLHSGDYLQCALYLGDPGRAARAGGMLAAAVAEIAPEPDLVVAPAMGGLIIGHETARALGRPFLFTERADGEMVLRRGFAVAPGQRVVIVEDVVTTGKSTREVIDVLSADGAEVVALASLINRSGRVNPFEPRPYRALLEVDFPTWTAEACPLCADGVPIAKPGSRPITSPR
jgi:orotate phosphoribosyltransferase